jgi:hypothetical protein
MNMLRTVLAAAALAGLSGCSMLPSLPTEPWVKPYERERFADPVMNFGRDSLAARHSSHVREVREGSRGAVAVQGGGCGCN